MKYLLTYSLVLFALLLDSCYATRTPLHEWKNITGKNSPVTKYADINLFGFSAPKAPAKNNRKYIQFLLDSSNRVSMLFAREVSLSHLWKLSYRDSVILLSSRYESNGIVTQDSVVLYKKRLVHFNQSVVNGEQHNVYIRYVDLLNDSLLQYKRFEASYPIIKRISLNDALTIAEVSAKELPVQLKRDKIFTYTNKNYNFHVNDISLFWIVFNYFFSFDLIGRD